MLTQTDDCGTHVFVRIGILGRQMFRDRSHFLLRLSYGHTPIEPGDGLIDAPSSTRARFKY